MRNLINGLLGVVFVCLSSSATAQTPPNELGDFLKRIGLDDYVAMTRQAQADGLAYNEMNRRQQLLNMNTYQTVNSSRDLAVFIYSTLEPRLNDALLNKMLVNFTAKMLALKPLPPRTDYPTGIMKIADGWDRAEALNIWLEGQRRKQIETHARQVVADIAGLLYGTDFRGHELQLAQIYDQVSVIMDRVYLDSLVGQTRYFGRALAALIARHDKLANDASMLKQLSKTMLSKYDMHLENFLGDTWVIDGSKSVERIKVENGSMILTRNLTAESLMIAFATVSKIPETREVARRKGLVGQLRAAPYFVTPEMAADGISPRMRLNDAIQQMDLPMSAGFSHIGYVMIKQDPQTGIKMSFTIDNYPAAAADGSGILANPGGVRITGLEQMLDASHHSKIAIGSLNHAKFHRWSQEAWSVIGYPKNGNIYSSYAVELEDAEPVLSKNPRNDPWKILISRDEYNRLHTIKNPDDWYKAVSNNFIEKGLMDMFKRGVYFQWVEEGAYFKGGAYCSQTGFLAWLQSNGEFIERMYSPGQAAEFKSKLKEAQKKNPGFTSADGWTWHVYALASVGDFLEKMKNNDIFTSFAEGILNSKAMKNARIVTKLDVVSPSGMLGQQHIDSTVVDLKDHRIEDRVQIPYRNYKENDRKALEQIDQLLPRADKRFQTALVKPANATDTAGASVRDIEYRMAIFGAKGLKTPVKTEDVAEIGATEEMKNIRRRWNKDGRPNDVAQIRKSAAK